jgi:hypothetical protein
LDFSRDLRGIKSILAEDVAQGFSRLIFIGFDKSCSQLQFCSRHQLAIIRRLLDAQHLHVTDKIGGFCLYQQIHAAGTFVRIH